MLVSLVTVSINVISVCFIACANSSLFMPFKESAGGCWLDQGKTLEHYNLKSGDMLVYKEKNRPLRVRTLDGSVKTLIIDDSQTVAELIKVVCARIGRLIVFPSCSCRVQLTHTLNFLQVCIIQRSFL